MSSATVQLLVFCFIMAAIALITYLKCAGENRHSKDGNKEYFLAGGGLSWIFIAGSITLTNLSTDQLVGANGYQMLLVVWWELAGFLGLLILAWVFLPVYYRHQCTTTTEFLEKRYNSKHIRAMIGLMFLLLNIFVFQPVVLYSGALFMKSMFDTEIALVSIAAIFALVGAGYAIFGGLRAVAVSDTYSGVLLLGMGLLVVFLSLYAIDFDFSGIPEERLTLVGDADSPIPWTTLFTGMILIQAFYWSTNQNITQRAMAAPSLAEARKGVFAAAAIRILFIPVMIVVPGIVSYKLFGDVGDSAYGMVIAEVLPTWLSGVFAAAMATAVLSSINSQLNSSASLYVCDLHENYINPKPNVPILSGIITFIFVIIAIAMVPFYARSESILGTVQELFGIISMPILSTFVIGVLFRNVSAMAAIIAVVVGSGGYAFFVFTTMPIHYIHLMCINFFLCSALILTLSRYLFKMTPEFINPRNQNSAWETEGDDKGVPDEVTG